MSPAGIPLSIIEISKVGCKRSVATSIIINNGAIIVGFQYGLRNLNSFFIKLTNFFHLQKLLNYLSSYSPFFEKKMFITIAFPNSCMLQLLGGEMMTTEKVAYQELREMIRKLDRLAENLDDYEKSCCGITTCQCHALVEIGKSGGVSLEGLSKVLGLDSSTLSRTVNTLVNFGSVEREVDKNDRRFVRIKLTKKGKKQFQDIEITMDQYFEKIYQELPLDKIEQVLESFNLVIKAIQKTQCCQI